MSAFDKIIGYDTIKDELRQICDMVKNPALYKRLGAKLPRGVLLYGEPGLGKSLMVQCLVEECGINCITVRKNVGGDGFLDVIEQAFEQAKETAPCIVFFDDMDKFANEDRLHPDTEEYVAIQAGIDSVNGHEVYVFATVNDREKLPDSLCRPGRFDRKIEVEVPTEADAREIIKYYLSDKKLAAGVDMTDVEKMIRYSSCAELETILNEAAIHAGYERKPEIELSDLVQAVLRMQYDAPDDYSNVSEDELRRTAYHEAGHAVVCECLAAGSVGLASIRSTGRSDAGGFIHRCVDLNRRQDVMVSLGGKAAVELHYSETCANGCQSDIARAVRMIRGGIRESGTHGLGMIAVNPRGDSESYEERLEPVIKAELEQAMFRTRNILIKNRALLERMAEELIAKETLLHSDICRICEEAGIVRVTP